MMEDLRTQIDEIDADIVALLGKRMNVVRQVTERKKQNGLPAHIPERIAEVIGHAKALAERHHVDPQMVEELYKTIIAHAVAYESEHL